MKKTESKNWIVFIIGIILIYLFIFIFSTYKEDILYGKQKKTILNYIKEQYNIKPALYSIQKINNINNHKYAYYAYMHYNDFNFVAYLYDDKKTTDTYMSGKLGRDIYSDVLNSIEKEFNTKILNVNELNNVYLGYYDDTTVSSDMTVDSLLNQTEKNTSLCLTFVVKNNSLSDIELANHLSNWINNYAKEKNVDYVSVMLDFINKKYHSTVEKKQYDSGYVRRYIILIKADPKNVTKEEINGSIQTTTDYRFYKKTLIKE